MLDLFGNHIVSFPTRRLIFDRNSLVLLAIISQTFDRSFSVCPSVQSLDKSLDNSTAETEGENKRM